MGQRIFSNLNNDSSVGKEERNNYWLEIAFGLQGTHGQLQNADRKTFKYQGNDALRE